MARRESAQDQYQVIQDQEVSPEEENTSAIVAKAKEIFSDRSKFSGEKRSMLKDYLDSIRDGTQIIGAVRTLFNAEEKNDLPFMILDTIQYRGTVDVDEGIAEAVEELREKEDSGSNDKKYLGKLIQCSNSEEFLRVIIQEDTNPTEERRSLRHVELDYAVLAIERLQKMGKIEDEEIRRIVLEYGPDDRNNFQESKIARLLTDHNTIKAVIEDLGSGKVCDLLSQGISFAINPETDPDLVRKLLENVRNNEQLISYASRLLKEDVLPNEAKALSDIIAQGSISDPRLESPYLRDMSKYSNTLIQNGFFDLYPEHLKKIAVDSTFDEIGQRSKSFVDFRIAAQKRLQSKEVRAIFGDLLDDIEGNAEEMERIRTDIQEKRKAELKAYHEARAAEEEALKNLTDRDLTGAWVEGSQEVLF
ncbi:hypothetical protein KKH43_01555 [Patescibacteria group bacterium]|nr:hypothetical protein [Patescibacteria group bacterium]